MTKLIIQHLWSDFKKHWLNFSILFALWTICYFTFGFSTPSASIGLGLAFVLLLSVKLPIRSLKALSFCPADTKIKRRLLLMYLLVKILICLLIFSFYNIIIVQFYSGNYHISVSIYHDSAISVGTPWDCIRCAPEIPYRNSCCCPARRTGRSW